MSDPRQLVFNDYDTIHGSHPIIDGLAMVDAGVITGESVESGYINAGRVTIGDGALAPVVLSAVRDGDTLVLSVMCRGDTSFDDNDCVMIALRPNGAADAGPQRRMDIYPLWGDFPAGAVTPATLGTGFGADRPNPMDAAQHLHDPEDFATGHVRTNKPAHVVDYWQRAGTSGDWSPLTPDMVGNTAKFDIKARSWEPVMASLPDERAWSIEVRFPIGTAGGTTNWIDLQDDFGIYVNVIRMHRKVVDGIDLGFDATQYVFPVTPPVTSELFVDHSFDVPDSAFGHGLKGAAVATASGVRFKSGAWGIGRRARGGPAGSPLGTTISKTVDNDIVAMLENTGDAANGISAQAYLADFGLPPPLFWEQPSGCQQPSPSVNLLAGTLALPSEGETINEWDAASVTIPAGAHRCMWIQLDASSTVVFSQASVRRNMNIVDLSSVTQEITVSGDQYPDPTDGSGKHEFLLRTRCRKIVVKELVRARDLDPLTTEILKAGLTFRPEGKEEEGFAGHNFTKQAAGTATGQDWQDTVLYLWITEGHRRTDFYINVRGTRARLYDPTPQDFGFLARHEGVTDNMNWAFEANGADMTRHDLGAISVRVPHKGETRFKVTLSAGPGVKPGDQSNSIPGPDGRSFDYDGGDEPRVEPDEGCRGLLWRLIRMILKRLFGSNG
jgi:hypothetical protein